MSNTKPKAMILKHNRSTRIMHWVHLVSFVILLVTGIGFYFHIDWINAAFMGPANASLVHRVMAVVFTVIPLFYILTNWGSFARFIDTISSIGKDDIKWLTIMGGYIPFLKGDVPPQDKYTPARRSWAGLSSSAASCSS